MATASVELSSPASLNKGSASFMGSSPTMYSPPSDKRFWSTLRSRVESLLENRSSSDQSLSSQHDATETYRRKRLKEDSLLLLRGFDSVSNSLCQLSNNIEEALQGARDLTKPPTLNEIVRTTLENAKKEEMKDKTEEEEKRDEKRGSKRKLDGEEEQEDDSHKQDEKSRKDWGKLNKAKNLAISMASKAASLARELKSIKSELFFMQDRRTLLEEENRRLRDGFSEGFQPQEDDLVRLQLEVLLAEKSRLANENANLTRENECLRHLVEYHQLSSQELSASYENLIKGMWLDIDEDGNEGLKTPRYNIF